MKIYVVGSSRNRFLPLDNIREKFLIDQAHEGDNIDFLNPWYCELTGLYYMWKHVNDEIVGLEHYRRYFVNANGKLLGESEILELLKDNDVLCKKFIFKEHNQISIFRKWYDSGDWWKLENFVNKIEDPEMRGFFLEKMKTQEFYYHCNMFISRRSIMDKYCEWLFYTLSKLKKEEFYRYKRLCGYLVEYTFGLWLQYNGYKIKDQRVKVLEWKN